MKKSILDIALAEKRKEVKLLQEWQPSDFDKMKRALKKAFLFKNLSTKDGTKICYSYDQLEQLIGLPYTSGSEVAAMWANCNTHLFNGKYPGYYYLGFAIGEDGKCYAMLQDKDENEILLPL